MADNLTDTVRVEQCDLAAMQSVLWVETIIDDQNAIAETFARHRLSAANAQDEALRVARMALEPFAREADRWTSATGDETPMQALPITQAGWEYRFTLGDLRRTRTALSLITKDQVDD